MKVLVADKISPKGVAYLRQQPGLEVVEAYGSSPEKVLELVKDVHAIAVRSETKITAEVFRAAPLLKVVGRAGVGVDNVDVEAATNHGVVVRDPNPDAAKLCVDLGARAAGSVAELAAECEVVITSLAMPHIVEEVALGADGIAANAKPGTVYIDLSTNSPATARKLAEKTQRPVVVLVGDEYHGFNR